jgi:pimeloyl-ACP methyl ester carboxylesterase
MAVDTINGTTLGYDVEGEGDPVVLVHGSWIDRNTWAFVAPALTGSFRVVTYDRRGHGESVPEPEGSTVHDDVADLAALITALDLAPAHLVGTSMGSCIALRLAASHPELVARMVCHEPPLRTLLKADPETRPIVEDEERKLDVVRERLEQGDHVGAAEYFVDDVAFGPGTWAQLPPPLPDVTVHHAPTFLGELLDQDAFRAEPELLERATAPVLLTNGEQSPPLFAAVLERVVRLVPDGRVQVIPGAGHVPHVSHAREYVPVVRSFLMGEDGTVPTVVAE